jgi:hypothetical protein
MTLTQTRPAYTGEFENELFDLTAVRYAPNIPRSRIDAPRDPATDDERAGLVDVYVWSAAHDLFIVQLASSVVDSLFHDDLDFQLVLSRQIGDDGAHAWAARDRIIEVSGRDETDRIARAAQAHWGRVGDVATRNWRGFFAWELHYEHHILPKVLIRRRMSRIADLPFRSFAEGRIVPDEEFHRIKITEWWQRKLAAASPAQSEEWVGEVLAADEELQQILNPYLRESWDLIERTSQIDTRNHVPLYDAWRRGMLAYHLNREIEELPALTSLGVVPVAEAAE